MNECTKEQELEILELLSEILPLYDGDDWIKIKKYVVRYSNPNTRKLFSTRHVKTKKHTLNAFEKSLLLTIEDIYKKKLILYKKDKHDCE